MAIEDNISFKHFERGHDWVSLTVPQTLKDVSTYMKPLYAEMSQGKPFGHSSSRAEQRVKYFKFYSEAKLFLKFSWQPVMRRFDVCFKNLAQTDKPGARNPNKQCEKARTIPGRFIPSLWPEHARSSHSTRLCSAAMSPEENQTSALCCVTLKHLCCPPARSAFLPVCSWTHRLCEHTHEACKGCW